MAPLSEAASGRGTVLVTGIDGFTGRYVRAELSAANFRVVGVSHEREDLAHEIYRVDLLDEAAVRALVAQVQPATVVHLAAIAFVAHGSVESIYATNLVGTRNLLAALADSPSRPKKVILASSANVYGNSDEEQVTEDAPYRPENDYAVSKVAMEYMARTWLEKLPIVIARPFNYTGVGQGRQFLVPKIVDHYRRGKKTIELGNIDVVRDFLDVRDVARFYAALVDRAASGSVFNLCSGRGYSLRWILDQLSSLAGYEIKVSVNPEFVRPNEIRRLVGSANRIGMLAKDASPRPFEETIEWMYVSAEAK